MQKNLDKKDNRPPEFIAAIDLLFLLLIILLLGLFAIRYDANKGTGELYSQPIKTILPDNANYMKNPHQLFYAVIIYENKISLLKIVGQKVIEKNEFDSIENFSKKIINNEPYVIYEKSQNNNLSNLIRTLAVNHALIYLAT